MLTVAKVNNKNTRTNVMLYLSLTLNSFSRLILIFLLLTLNMYLSLGHKIKSTKQLKCTLNNRAVSLKHVATFNMSKSTWFK